MGERLTFTFALTGRRNGEHGTQGVALGYELTALSGRSFSHLFVYHVRMLRRYAIWLKTAKSFSGFRTPYATDCAFILGAKRGAA